MSRQIKSSQVNLFKAEHKRKRYKNWNQEILGRYKAVKLYAKYIEDIDFMIELMCIPIRPSSFIVLYMFLFFNFYVLLYDIHFHNNNNNNNRQRELYVSNNTIQYRTANRSKFTVFSRFHCLTLFVVHKLPAIKLLLFLALLHDTLSSPEFSLP